MSTDSNGDPKKENLFDYTEDQLLEEGVLTHYQILGIEEHASTDGVKKAYRKASLKYHPDKTGRGDDDYVFLAVKKAYDVLSDHAKRSTYDSTALSFDDSIPPPRSQLIQDPLLLYKDDDFYELFGSVFKRNLRFDANLRPDAPGIVKKNKNNSRNKDNGAGVKGFQPPSLGDDDTPIEEVHKFYEYWIHFESWRDFTAQAMDELQVENELENAESRYEKRWLQKEVDKRAKQLKTKENGRIQTLVERAMEADPRLRRERQALQEAKDQAKAERAAMADRKKEEEQQARVEAERQAEEDKRKRAEEKVAREQEKKHVRKARQQLRRLTSSSFEEAAAPVVWADSYDMSLDVDYLCTNLSLEDLKKLNDDYSKLAEADGETAALTMVRERAVEQRDSENNNNNKQPLSSSETNNTDQADKSQTNSKSSKSKPWTKDELSALAKGVKKYPPGGASRWDQISLFVNNLCKQEDPRSKEECIQKYNDITKSAAASSSSTASSTKPPPPAPTVVDVQSISSKAASPTEDEGDQQTEPTTGNDGEAAGSSATSSVVNGGVKNDSVTSTTTATPSPDDDKSSAEDFWTPEQDQQLQNALATYPASMEKNARWTAIAEAVQGKSKKLCVQRFKAIRDALKNRK
ncbi:hypothetical protein ACA910_022194 [Epithemia clementina (nom. ined.)]